MTTPNEQARVVKIILADEQFSKGRAPTFAAMLDGTKLCRSHTPIYEAARILIAQGYDPGIIFEARHEGSETVSMRGPIGELAKWTVVETQKHGLQRRKWTPYALPAQQQSKDAA